MSTASNALDSLREIVLTLLPWLLKLGVWTYRVERVNADGTLDLAPTSPIPPRLPAVPQWLVGGVEVTPLVGSLVGVVYLDAPVPDAKPIPAIVAFAPLRLSVPMAIKIGGTSAPAALRVGDVRGLVFDPGVPSATPPAAYYTADGGASFVVVAMVAPGSTVGGTVPPLPATPYTQLAPSGSAKVTIA